MNQDSNKFPTNLCNIYLFGNLALNLHGNGQRTICKLLNPSLDLCRPKIFIVIIGLFGPQQFYMSKYYEKTNTIHIATYSLDSCPFSMDSAIPTTLKNNQNY